MAKGVLNASLQRYLELLQRPVAEPSLEPDLDDIDEKADALIKEQMALSSGALRKGIIEQGQGSERPKEGDMVLFHLSLKKQDGNVLQTSRPEEGGNGIPQAYILGRGKRLPRGWELALQDMLLGERAAFQIAPELSLAQKGCQIKPPEGVSLEADLVLDFQLVLWYSKSNVKPVGDEGVIIRTLKSSDSWEHPRPPFEVSASISARLPSSSGKQGEGIPYYSSREPLQWTMGSRKLSRHLEEGVSAMAKTERAILSCPVEPEDLDDPLLPQPPAGVDRVEYEVELHSMVQVRDMTGTGEVTKRRLREGVGEFPIDCPLEDNAVKAHFKAYNLDTGEAFYNSRGADGNASPLEFDTGVDAVPEAVDMCIRLMTPTEIASVTSVPKFAYQGRTDIPEGCPRDNSVGFEIELISFEKTPHWHSMTAQDKITRAEQVRQQGNVAFKLGQLRMARQKYLKAMKLLDSAFDTETEEQISAASTAKASCLVNLGTVSQKEGNVMECLDWCDKALREQPDHAKALYRKAIAHSMIGNYVEAEDNFVRAKTADPNISAEIDREISRSKSKEKAAKLRERNDLQNFFGRTKPN